MSILQRHTPQERDMEPPQCIMDAHSMLSGGTPDSADPSSCCYLQIHLKSCHIFDDEHNVFICLQEIVGNNVQSMQVWRDDLQSFFFPSASIHFLQEIKCSRKCGLDVLAVSLTVICLYILICILKRIGRWKSMEDRGSVVLLHKYYLWIWVMDLFLGRGGVDFIMLIKKTVSVKKKPFLRFIFLFISCLELGCYDWHEDIYVLFLCIVITDSLWLVLVIWI